MAFASTAAVGGVKQPMTITRFVGLALKGAAMGAANVIPGVSGGTIALISGIYADLIGTLKSFDWQAGKLLLKADFRKCFEKIPFLRFFVEFLRVNRNISVVFFFRATREEIF